MADDTVEAARRALLIECDDCLERAFAQHGKGSGRMVELIDALVAAVRAEQHKPQDIADHTLRQIALQYGSTTKRDFRVIEIVLAQVGRAEI